MKSREESFIEVLDELLPCYGVFGYTNRIVNGNFVEGHQKLLVIGKSFEIIYESDPAFTKRGEFPKSFKKFEKSLNLCRQWIRTETNVEDMLANLLVSSVLKDQVDLNIKCSDEFEELYKMSKFHNWYLITDYKLETDSFSNKIQYLNNDIVLKEYENAKTFLEKNTSVTPIQDALEYWLHSIGKDYPGTIDFACGKIILRETDEDGTL